MNEATIEIPPNTQYLKFSRPKLQYNQFIVKRALDSHKKQLLRISNPDFQFSNTSVLTNYLPEYPTDLMQNSNDEAVTLLNEGNAELGMVYFLNNRYRLTEFTEIKLKI